MRTRLFTLYSIVITLLEEAALVVIVLLVLPEVGISIPLWGLIALVVASGVLSYVLYRLGKKALARRPLVALEDLIGSRGEVVEPLVPQGYVRIRGELWKASSSDVGVGVVRRSWWWE